MSIQNFSKQIYISLPFFTLKKKDHEIFADNEKQILKHGFIYPKPNCEMDRINALSSSLVRHSFKVESCSTARRTNYYCQFSGGGDLCIDKPAAAPLVFLADNSPPPDDVPQSSEDAGNTLSSNTSPPTPGTCKLASFTIEGKKDEEKLKYQLWANVIVATVDSFIERIEDFTTENILGVEELRGYGMACTGSGVIGVYKVEMKFNDPSRFVTKIPIGTRERLYTAGIMDYTLNYYLNNA